MAVLTMIIDDADVAIIQQCAMLEGKSVSNFARDAVLERVERMRSSADLRAKLVDDDFERLLQYQVLAELRL